MKMLLLALFISGCYEQQNRDWTTILSSKKWYEDIKGEEKRFLGKIYDKGITKWIIKGDMPEARNGIIEDDLLTYKKGEEYTRFLFETGSCIYDLYLEDFWAEKKMIEVLCLDNPKEAKRLSSKKFEIIGKERVIFEEGIKRREFVGRMIRER